MALLDLSFITKSVIKLIETGFDSSKAWTNPAPPDVSPEPPNRIKQAGLGFYLYHIQENAHYKNMPLAGHGNLPIQYTSMGLNLYYQLSANSVAPTDPSYDEQLMMSVAMKALHDYPQITESTVIQYVDKNNATIHRVHLLTALEQLSNKFRFNISLLPITYNEAIQFWTAEESPMKLSAYYELSVVFLEPEPPVTISGRVLAYGVNVFTEGAPQIIGSQNFITFKIPTVVETQELKAQPAQVAVGGTFSLLGTGFTGSPLDVVISNALLPKSCIVPLNDPNWKVELKGSNELSVKVYNTIDLPKEKPTDPTVSKDILPGLYAIQIRVSRRFKLPNGTERAVEHLSNQFPFTVTPRIDTVSPVAVGGKVTITGSVFKNTRLTEKDIQVYVGNDLYTLTSSGAAGTVDIQNPTTLVVTLLTGLKSKDYLPFRLIILGGESAPNWIQIP